MHVYQTKLICKTFHGLEPVLAAELAELKATNIQIVKRAVICDFTWELLYRCNLQLRTCLKVLVPIWEFRSTSPEDLYKFSSTLPWEDYFNVNQTFAIDFTIQSNYFKHSQFASLKLKDAICDHFRKCFQKRPSVATKQPDILFNLHIFNHQVTISLDSSGTSLHQRGNRLRQHEAPLNEVLAAGLILLSKWDQKSTFVDAMCGSGTILLEAASLASNHAANLHRDYFCFKNWPKYDGNLFKQICHELTKQIKPITCKIYGSDASHNALSMAQANIRRAGFESAIELKQAPIQKMIPPQPPGILIINPPYGERMQHEDIERLYQEIGDAFKQHFAGYTCCLLTSNLEAMKNFGLKSSKKYPLTNGKLDCIFYLYDIYQGTKRTFTAKQ